MRKLLHPQKWDMQKKKITNTYITKYFRCSSGGPTMLDTIYDAFLCCKEVLAKTWIRKLPSSAHLAFLPAHLSGSLKDSEALSASSATSKSPKVSGGSTARQGWVWKPWLALGRWLSWEQPLSCPCPEQRQGQGASRATNWVKQEQRAPLSRDCIYTHTLPVLQGSWDIYDKWEWFGTKVSQRISLETWLHAFTKFILEIREEKKRRKKNQDP